ncbi:MAG TPA: ATPase, T2SS/T4P/T4SS family, partial [Herpetosiphonaceae bacterium]
GLPVEEWACIPWSGPIEQWVNDATVSDVLVNGPHRPVTIVQKGSRLSTSVFLHRDWITFTQRQLLLRSHVVSPDTWPKPLLIGTADRRLRYAVTSAVATPDGPTLAVRVLPERWRTLDDVIRDKLLSRQSAEVLVYALRNGVTVLVSGGTGSGKTTVTAALLQAIGEHARVVVIEEARELPSLHDSVSVEVGHSGMSFPECVTFSLRQKPDLIVVGEVRGPEAMAMLQAARSGHPGIGTIHAPDAQAALRNLEGMACEMPHVHPQIVRGVLTSSAVPLLVVQIGRYNGLRRVGSIEEVIPQGRSGQAGDRYVTSTLFSYDDTQDALVKRYAVQGAWGRGRF